MNNWNRNMSLVRSGHGRSGSGSSVTYSTTNYQPATLLISDTSYCHAPPANHYASYVDISSVGDSGSDTRRHFSWRSPASDPEIISKKEKVNCQAQGPFESAFKSAISKMKESSINRLGIVDKTGKGDYAFPNKFEEMYKRNCVTLPVKKILVEHKGPRPVHQVFKCNSSIDHDKDDDFSISIFNAESASETEMEKRIKNKEYDSFRKVSLDQAELQDQKKSESSNSFLRKNVPKLEPQLFSGSNIVPVKSSFQVKPPKSKISVVSEAYISPKINVKQHTTIPQAVQNYVEDDEGPEFEPLSSVQDIIAKVEALTNASDNKPASKSHIHHIERTPLNKPQRSNSQKSIETSRTDLQCEQIYEPKKRMLGIYKKSTLTEMKGNPVNNIPLDYKSHPSPLKGKQIDNIPFDFKKLHNAFLDQKKEIKNLKEELDAKNIYILQLESEIRNYEPWR